MVEGFQDLCRRLLTDRIMRGYRSSFELIDRARMVARRLRRGSLSGGSRRIIQSQHLDVPRIPDLERLLNELRHYGGDRISILMDDSLLPRLAVGSSLFDVVLSRSACFRYRVAGRM